MVPTVKGVRMRSVAIGDTHALALSDEGQLYLWGSIQTTSGPPEVPTLFEEVGALKMRQTAAGNGHSVALTDEGQLYTWWDSTLALQEWVEAGAAGAGYPLPELGDDRRALYRPRCVEAIAGMRIISVAAGLNFTIVATDEGALARAHTLVPTP